VPAYVRVRRTLVVLLLAVLPLPVAAGAQDLDSVKQQVTELESNLADTTAAYEAAWARVEAAQSELISLEAKATELEEQAAEADAVLADRTRSMFKYGGDPVLQSLLSSDGPQGAIERASLMAALTGRDLAQLESAVALRQQLDQTQALAADTAAELEASRAELEQQKQALAGQLDSAKALQSDLEARAARQRQINRGVQNGTYACIFERGSSHFTNSWGAPRSGGRSHKGTDVMSYYNNPVFAFTSGRITRMNSGGLGGIQLYLWGDDGNEYFYAHLASYASTAYVGKRVEAGEHLAFNGDTGNARGGAPHVHFEIHPGGGGAVNPYPWLSAACF
jgi:peptidoglycan LD-endopeptidase LytH